MNTAAQVRTRCLVSGGYSDGERGGYIEVCIQRPDNINGYNGGYNGGFCGGYSGLNAAAPF